jgi:hypothetical protein
MWVVSDEVNSYGGVIPGELHPQIAELMIGAPILVGHQTDSLPIARVFHAEKAERDGRSWVRGYFYWLRDADGAETLRSNIDGGIYQECSISFLYTKPICLLCQQDVRDCGHEPNREYRLHGRRQICSFRYEGISKVLECSLVYRGAIPNTLVTSASLSQAASSQLQETVISNLNDLPVHEWFLITPRYDGIRVAAEIDQSEGEIRVLSRQESLDEITIPIRRTGQSTRRVSGMLVGYRNRSRVSREQLLQALRGEMSEITKVVLYLLPAQEKHAMVQTSHPHFEIRTMPHASVHRGQLESKITLLASRRGVEIWPWGNGESWNDVYAYELSEANRPADVSQFVQCRDSVPFVLQLSAVQSSKLRSGEMLVTHLKDESTPTKTECRGSDGMSIQSDRLIWQRVRRKGVYNWGVRMSVHSSTPKHLEGSHADCG